MVVVLAGLLSKVGHFGTRGVGESPTAVVRVA
jgi:hypothetical protein